MCSLEQLIRRIIVIINFRRVIVIIIILERVAI